MQRISGPLARDAGLALLLAAASFALEARPFREVFVKYPVGDLTAIWNARVAWWWVAAVPAVVALLIRRWWPVAALVLASASAFAHLLDQDIGMLPLDFAVVVVLFTLASTGTSRRQGLLALGALLVALYPAALASLLGLGPRPIESYGVGAKPVGATSDKVGLRLLVNALQGATPPAMVLGIGWAVGDNSRTRRLHLATLVQRAADLQRERDQRAALAVAAERARITRELHDVVAHGISVMVVQAQGAAAALRRHPERTEAALANVIDVGRSSLAEMRRLLGLVRQSPGGRPQLDPQLNPQPSIGALPALVDQVRDAGTEVTLLIEGEPVPLPTSVDLSAYRIVQEALTNTLKHAGPGASSTVRLAFAPTDLEIDVTDDGGGLAVGSTLDGNGLRGIAERVAALGGQIDVGPREPGGFGVRVRLPIEGGRP